MQHTEFLYLPAAKKAQKAGKKYQLAKTFVITLPSGKSDEKVQERALKSMYAGRPDLSLIACRGGYKLTIPIGWEWDGPSGPTIDMPNNLLASLVHDALYSLGLPLSARAWADRMFYLLLRQEGMGWFRANYWWAGVRIGAESHFNTPKESTT